VSNVAFPGLQTGIDTSALIKQMVQASSGRLNLLESRKGLWESRRTAYSSLETDLKELRSAADQLRKASTLRAFEVSSSSEDVVKAEASSSASEGSHNIEIGRLASAQRSVHAGVETAESLVGEGVFAYTYDGEQRTIQTSATTTLQGLADLINSDAGNAGVAASVLEYDSGDGKAFHIVISGNESGSDYAIAIDDVATTLNGTNGTVDFTSAGFTVTQQALDSQIRIDGYPSGDWIERSGNTIDDVIPGVTLKLQSTGTTSLSLSRDTEDLKGKVEDLVEAYNAVVKLLKDKTKYDEESRVAGPLIGEYTVGHVRQTLRLPLIERGLGFDEVADGLTLPGQLGLSVDRDGYLELDSDDWDDAVNDNYVAVLRLLGAEQTGASSSEQLKFYSAAAQTEPGTYEVEASFDGAGTLLSARIRTVGEDEWQQATVDGNMIIGAEGSDGQFLQMTASYNGNATETATVRVRQGFAGRMYDDIESMLDRTEGAVSLASARCKSTIDRLDDNIEQQQDRLVKMQNMLMLRFARLERTLASMESQRAALGMIA
jgi:flagellar hook-associated protein 2